MDKLRAQVQHAQQLAAAEVQRAEGFYDTHRSDVSRSTSDSLIRLCRLGWRDSCSLNPRVYHKWREPLPDRVSVRGTRS